MAGRGRRLIPLPGSGLHLNYNTGKIFEELAGCDQIQAYLPLPEGGRGDLAIGEVLALLSGRKLLDPIIRLWPS